MVNGLSGQRMLIGLAIGIICLIFMVLKTKIQAFLALIVSTVIVGVVGGMPLLNITLENGKTFGIINSITSGFGGTLGSIGIIIGFGVMMGQIFEVTGAAKRMAHTFLKIFGKGKEEEALAFTGFLVSIPIFCDSGFVVLAPIAKALSRATKKSVISLGVALAAGLVITHSLVPPTPGPLGVCGIFGIDVGFFILLSIVLALPMAIACIFYSRKVLAKKYYWLMDDNDEIHPAEYQEPDYEAAFSMDMDGVPGTFESFGPLLLPIVLILINTVASALKATTGFMEVLVFLGQPIVAVGLGLLLGQSNSDRRDGKRYGKRRYHHAGYRRRRRSRSDHQGFRTWLLYGRRTGKGFHSADHSSPGYFYSYAFHSGFRYSCYDNCCFHLRTDPDRGRRESYTWRDRMLRRLPVLWLLQRFLLLGRQQNAGCQRSKGSAADLVYHIHHCLGSRCCGSYRTELLHALIVHSRVSNKSQTRN